MEDLKLTDLFSEILKEEELSDIKGGYVPPRTCSTNAYCGDDGKHTSYGVMDAD